MNKLIKTNIRNLLCTRNNEVSVNIYVNSAETFPGCMNGKQEPQTVRASNSPGEMLTHTVV